MDLQNTIPANDTVVVELEFNGETLMNDDGSPMTIEVYLPHSKEYRKCRHEQADTLIAKQADRLKSAEAEELGVEFLAKTTKTWNITFGGKKPKFSTSKAKEIYSTVIWVGDLIAAKVEESKVFTKA